MNKKAQNQLVVLALVLAFASCAGSESDPGRRINPKLVIPSDLAATVVAAGRVEVTWSDPSEEEDGFQIERAVGASGSFEFLGETDANVTTFPDSGLETGEIYAYRVCAFQGDFCSQFSNVATVTVPLVPGAPGNVQAVGTGPTTVRVTWSDLSTLEDRYEIVRYDNRFHTGIPVTATLAAGSESHDDTGLVSGTTYYYFVNACNVSGCGYSGEVTATTGDASGALASPSGLTAETISHERIDLAWEDKSDNELGFQIERSPNGTTGWEAIGSTGENALEFSDTDGLAPETPYFYRVRGFNTDSQSQYSNVAEGETGSLPNVLPGAPEDLYAQAVSAIQVDLTWIDTANNETGFHVYRAASAEGPWTKLTRVNVSPLPLNTVHFTQAYSNAVSVSTLYFYKVVAFNAEGTAESNIASVTTPPVPTSAPAAPTSFTATAIAGLKISATWHDNATNEYHYMVQKSLNSGGDWSNCYAYKAPGAAANKTSYEGGCTLTAGTVYRFRVYAYNPAGTTYSNTVTGVTALP